MIHPSPTTLETQYGRLDSDCSTYQPLDQAVIRVTGRAAGDTRCTVRLCDPLQRLYAQQDVELVENQATVVFRVAGMAGVHYLYLHFAGETRWSRYLNIAVRPETTIQSGDADFDQIFPFTQSQMQLGRREYHTPRGKFVGYISADTWHFDGIWLRDWIYSLPAYRYWERDMACGLDRFLEMQAENGMLLDGIERDGRTWRVGLESDVEYIMVLGVWQTWQVTGDDAWLRAALPRLERALAYIRSDPKHWDAAYQLVKRQHSCDTWDFDIDGATDHGDRRHVIATCDQSGYYQAFVALARLYAALGEDAQARHWETEANAYRQRAVDLLWDGTKFLHHIHLDPIDHAGFDESQQLAMGNTWALTRGLASGDQARSVVDEYRRRHAQSGDAYPWWSLQPGYPDELGYFKEEHRQQGGYANGGLMPWVGGELCRAAFQCGRERYAVQLLRQYADHLRRTGGAQVWYWPDGRPGFRTTNEVRYAGWGMAQWTAALVEGLAGVVDTANSLQRVQVSPRWAAAAVEQARVVVAYAASGACFAYTQHIDSSARRITLEWSGSGETVDFHLLLGADWKCAALTIDGQAQPCKVVVEDHSVYVDFSGPAAGVHQAELVCG